MTRLGLAFVVGLIVTPLGAYVSGPQIAPADPAHALRELEQHWLDVEDDPIALEGILAPDFLHVLPMGIITRDDQLSFMRRHPAPPRGERRFEDIRVRIYGTVGIVNGIVAAKDGGSTRRTLFTDVFAYRDGVWQAVNAQELQMADGR